MCCVHFDIHQHLEVAILHHPTAHAAPNHQHLEVTSLHHLTTTDLTTHEHHEVARLLVVAAAVLLGMQPSPRSVAASLLAMVLVLHSLRIVAVGSHGTLERLASSVEAPAVVVERASSVERQLCGAPGLHTLPALRTHMEFSD